MANDAEPEDNSERPRRSWSELVAAVMVYVTFGAQRVWFADVWRTWHITHGFSPGGPGPDDWMVPVHGGFPEVVAAVVWLGFKPRPVLFLPSYLAGVGVWIVLVHTGVIQAQVNWTQRLVFVVGSAVLIWVILPLFFRIMRKIEDLEL